MATALSIFGVAFAALCVWLAVRIVNRRERWAKRMFAAMIALPMLYVAGLGPACWISSRMNCGAGVAAALCTPMHRLVYPDPWVTRNNQFQILCVRYTKLYAAPGWNWSYSDAYGLRWQK